MNKHIRNYLLLTKAIRNNSGEMEMPEQGGKKKAYNIMGVMAMTCIMIPCCIIVGFIVYVMTAAMEETGGNTEGLELIVQLMNVFAVIFSIMVIFNMLFFSSDLDHLLPLPVHPGELVAAKFTVAYLAESVMEFLILFSGFIGYFIAADFKPISVLTALFGIFLIPFLPLVYCGIFSLLIMAFLNKAKLLKNVDFMVGLVTVIFAGLFILSFVQLDSVSINSYITGLGNGDNIFTNIMGKIFFTVPFFLKAVETNNIIYLILFILINFVAGIILYVLGNRLYIRGVQLVSSTEKTSKKRAAAEKKIYKKHSVAVSYFLKECRMLNRTPAYKKYCSYINIIWPVITIALFMVPSTKHFMEDFKKVFVAGYVASDMIVLLFVVLLSCFATAMNCIASCCFTREGAHFSFMRYIPVSLRTQIHIKALVSIFYSGTAVIVSIVIMCIFMGCKPLMYIYFIITGILSVILCTYIGIMLDSSNPKLTWEDEYGALRGNLNAFFNMAIAIMTGIFLCAIGYVLYNFTELRTVSIYFIFMLVLFIADWQIIKMSVAVSVKNLENQNS